MKIKHIFVFSLVSIFAYHCSNGGGGSNTLLPLVGSGSTKNSVSNGPGYYFKEYSNSNAGRVAFNNIKAMTTEMRGAVSKSGTGDSTTCTGINLETDITTGLSTNQSPADSIRYIYNKRLHSLVPSNQQASITSLINAGITATSTSADSSYTGAGSVSPVNAGVTTGPTKNGFIAQWTHTSPTSNTKKSLSCYLMSKEGVEYVQYIEKGLFSIPYVEGMKILDTIASKNNTDPKTKYSDREKAWDTLFGYFGAPTNYSIANYQAGYLKGQTGLHNGYGIARSLNAAVKDVPGQISIRGYADDIMQNGFIAGRNAITNNDAVALAKAIQVVKKRWEHAIIIGGLSYAYYGYGALKGSLQIRSKIKHGLL